MFYILINKFNMDQLKTMVSSAEMSLYNFKTKNSMISGTRARSDLMSIKKLCDRLRKEILAEQKEMKMNKKASKASKQAKKQEEEAKQEEEPEVKAEEPVKPVMKRTRGRPRKVE